MIGTFRGLRQGSQVNLWKIWQTPSKIWHLYGKSPSKIWHLYGISFFNFSLAFVAWRKLFWDRK
jgi:hypothetical protein